MWCEYMIVERLNLFNKKTKCFVDFVEKIPAALVNEDDVLIVTQQTNRYLSWTTCSNSELVKKVF